MPSMSDKVRTSSLLEARAQGRPVVMVTAYDFPTGRLADEAGVDAILVGDSLGNTVLGFADTIPVTIDHMLHHTAAVRRGVERALLIADMPFMTYKISPEQALENAARFVQESGAESVKLEGGREACPAVRRIVDAGIPVLGHIGLTPQSVHALGGMRMQGRDEAAAERLVQDALALQDAGCYAVVVECVPWEVGRRVTEALEVPTIGIGAGAACSGQVLVLSDLIGLGEGKAPKFVKQYGRVGAAIKRAVRAYAREVREGAFPSKEHAYRPPRADAPEEGK